VFTPLSERLLDWARVEALAGRRSLRTRPALRRQAPRRLSVACAPSDHPDDH
jgi:hypothetical protein